MSDLRRSGRTPKPTKQFMIEETSRKPRPNVEQSDSSAEESSADELAELKDLVLSDQEGYEESVSPGKVEKPCYATQSSDDEDSEHGVKGSEKSGDCKNIYNNKFFIEECISTTTKKKQLTSKNTLGKSKEAQLGIDQIQEILRKSAPTHEKERQELFKDYTEYFPKWLALLKDGFNILLYGVGSKIELVELFASEKLTEEFYMSIHGFFPGMTLKNVLNSISEDIMSNTSVFSNTNQQIEFITGNLEHDLYLLIHNIDGQVLACEKNILAFSQLAKCEKIHLVTTVDHVNSGLLFDSNKHSNFSWVYFDVTTFAPYTVETSYENSLLLQQCRVLEMSSLKHVYKSLTPNAKKIFELIARHQLEQGSDSVGISFAELFRDCRESFLVNSELTLNAQLTEYKDHNMLRSRKGGDGIETLYIPLDKKTLIDFVEKLQEDLY